MLDGIIVDVIEVGLEIVLVFESVFPKASLPNAPSLLILFAGGDLHIPAAVRQEPRRKTLLDDAPATRIVGIAARQRPNRMQMIGQQHDCIQFKWPVSLAFSNHVA